MESSATQTHTGEPNQPKQVPNIHFSIKFISCNSQCQGLKACHALLSNEAKPMPKDNQKLKALVSVMHSLARVLTSAKVSRPESSISATSNPTWIFSIHFMNSSSNFIRLNHFKYELLNEKAH